MSSRLYIAGLNTSVEEHHLQKQFGKFGEILSVDIKEKKDADGNVLSRFAYVNIGANTAKVFECIEHFNGATWKGCELKVELAKESFLDRLKRERENAAKGISDDGQKDQLALQSYKHQNSNDSTENYAISNPRKRHEYEKRKYDKSDYDGNNDSSNNYSHHDDKTYNNDGSTNYSNKHEADDDYNQDFHNSKRRRFSKNDDTESSYYNNNEKFNNTGNDFRNGQKNYYNKSFDNNRNGNYRGNFKNFQYGDYDSEPSAAKPMIRFDPTASNKENNTDDGKRNTEDIDSVNYDSSKLDDSNNGMLNSTENVDENNQSPICLKFLIQPDDPRLKQAVKFFTSKLTEKEKQEFSKLNPLYFQKQQFTITEQSNSKRDKQKRRRKRKAASKGKIENK